MYVHESDVCLVSTSHFILNLYRAHSIHILVIVTYLAFLWINKKTKQNKKEAILVMVAETKEALRSIILHILSASVSLERHYCLYATHDFPTCRTYTKLWFRSTSVSSLLFFFLPCSVSNGSFTILHSSEIYYHCYDDDWITIFKMEMTW